MEIREGLLYAKSHEWVKEEGDVVTIGLTDYAQSELGDLVFVNLPEEGDSVSVGEAFGDVESVKAVSDIEISLDFCEPQAAKKHIMRSSKNPTFHLLTDFLPMLSILPETTTHSAFFLSSG